MTKLLSRIFHGPSAALRRPASFALLLFASATCSYVAMAAVVSLQPPSNNALLRIPVILTGEGGEDLAGLQFDLNFDATQYVLEGVEAGASTTDAGKEAVLSEPVPGKGRVLITGFNDDSVLDGHVATLILRPRTPDAVANGLAVSNLLATDPFGNSVPLAYEDGYGYPPKKPEKEEASLTAENDEGGEDPDTAIEDEVVGTEAASQSTAPAADSMDMGSTRGGGGTGIQPGTTAEERAESYPPRVIAQRPTTERPPAKNPPAGPYLYGSAASRPQTQATRSRARTQSPPRSAPIKSARGGATEPAAGEVSASPSTARSIENTRLALAIPDSRSIEAEGALRRAIPPGMDNDTGSRFFQKNWPMAALLFVVFFLTFSLLHVHIFRRLTVSTGRRRQ